MGFLAGTEFQKDWTPTSFTPLDLTELAYDVSKAGPQGYEHSSMGFSCAFQRLFMNYLIIVCLPDLDIWTNIAGDYLTGGIFEDRHSNFTNVSINRAFLVKDLFGRSFIL